MHYSGEEVQDIFDTLPSTGTTYDNAKQALNKHFCPEDCKDVEFERFTFRQARQLADESVAEFHTRLQRLASTCSFADKDGEVKSQIIQQCTSNKLRRFALREGSKLTLVGLLQTARMYEAADQHATEIEQSTASTLVNAVDVNAVNTNVQRSASCSCNFQGNHGPSHGPSQQRQQFSRSTTCRNCGGRYPHRPGRDCPAKGIVCHNCGKLNHFAKHCLSKPRQQTESKPSPSVHAINTESPSSHGANNHNETINSNTEHSRLSGKVNDYAFHIRDHDSTKKPTVEVHINGTPVQCVIDTGASVMVMGLQTFNDLTPRPALNSNTVPIYAYGSKSPLEIVGSFQATVSYKHSTVNTVVFVTMHSADTLLNFDTASSLGLVTIAYNVHSEEDSSPDFLSDYADRFEGIGKISSFVCTLHVDETVPPIAVPHRRIPFHMRQQVEKELERLVELDVIERVDQQPTPWVSPITVVKKPHNPSEIRLCVDMRNVNQAIKRERHITPTIDDIIVALNGAAVFSKLDLNSGYHQIPLAPESRKYTVFSTHAGLYQYKRLNFGLSSAAEIFQNAIQSTLRDLPGIINISDDILVFGSTQEEHDKRLHACLRRLREANLTLNRGKCRFRVTHVTYFGHVFSASGVAPDPEKIREIQAVTPPTNVSELRSFLGMVNYCGRFVPALASVSAPLRDLTRADVPWEWSQSHSQAFDEIKQRLAQCCTMAYFDFHSSTELIVDASPVGLGAVLTQHNSRGATSVIALASRALSPVEQRYSQTEREALAITWAVTHFHLYLYGSAFTVITDHKPLVSLFNNANSKPPLRIERWILKLQAYDMEVKYHPGKLNPADYMSRHPVKADHHSHEQNMAEAHVSFVALHSVPKTVTYAEIVAATKDDTVLQACMSAIIDNNWSDLFAHVDPISQAELKSLYNIRDELTVTKDSDLLIRDHRLVIPKSLRKRILNIAHEGHQGITKTKALLKEKVWFPSIDRHDGSHRSRLPCMPIQYN